MKKGMERLKTSPKCMWFHIILSIAVAIFLIFGYRLFSPWILGAVVALVLGNLWTVTFLKLIRNYIYRDTVKRKDTIVDIYIDRIAVPGWVVGSIERIFFAALVAFDISATAAAMVTWILVKMATDWHRILGKTEEDAHKSGARALAFSSLLASMISLFFALIGGLICRMALNP